MLENKAPRRRRHCQREPVGQVEFTDHGKTFGAGHGHGQLSLEGGCRQSQRGGTGLPIRAQEPLWQCTAALPRRTARQPTHTDGAAQALQRPAFAQKNHAHHQVVQHRRLHRLAQVGDGLVAQIHVAPGVLPGKPVPQGMRARRLALRRPGTSLPAAPSGTPHWPAAPLVGVS